jgi:DNA primase large subunit
MLCVLLGDRALISRYAAAEANKLDETLSKDLESIPTVLEALKVPIVREASQWRIHFSDYLRFAPTHETEWKMVLRPMRAGWIPMDDKSVARLCRAALEQRIIADLEEEKKHPIHDAVREAMQPYVDELAPKLAEAREHWQTGDFGPINRTAFPPCTQQLFEDMKNGKMIPHHGRFAIASFLGKIGMTAGDVLEYFKEIPNFDAEKSRYQIEHVLGDRGVEGYTPPGCGWMQTNGVCPLEKRDNLCFKIKHPLSYYRARQRFIKQDEEKAKHMIAAQTRKNQSGDGIQPAQARGSDGA